jgi:AraC family transcriptional regulator, regulatory protein of adaptative response / methylated-DNA-[protein]-cysteine methyltransferase
LPQKPRKIPSMKNTSQKPLSRRATNSATLSLVTIANEERWAAVVNKLQAYDGQFFFAVKTTGIFCRPSCPSRTPKRANVEFYDTSEQALSSGFRACLRCAPTGLSVRERQTQAILDACRQIEQSTEKISLTALATQVGLSSHHFHRTFKEVTGVTPHDFFKARQIAQLGAALQTQASVTTAMYAAGFNSSGRFYENVNAMLGMTPKSFKAGGTGELIRTSTQQSALGLMLVAATDKGICTIEFGDTKTELIDRLTKRFPKAVLKAQDETLTSWMNQLLEHVRAPEHSLSLPLDIRGTAFQQQVWNALQEIPLGKTASYFQVAQRIGRPKAVRAVATACANNVIAVVVPCHRVVRGNGDLSGYRWGVERKQILLENEAQRNPTKVTKP